jgi:pimeloyl-ACP methyl ester carboxylesterase
MNVQSFRINVPQATLDDLGTRLARTRWTDEVEGTQWDYGTNRAYMKELVEYWQQGYDWRKQEAKLNEYPQVRAKVDGMGIHFIHLRGKGPNPIPLILTHGWPDSFNRFRKVIPLLTNPEQFGGDPADSFDVIVPSIPGFGFSDRPRQRGMSLAHVAELWAKLMTNVLGYQRYAAAGGDFGSRVTRHLALAHPDQVLGIHLTDIGFPRDSAFIPNLYALPDLTPAERQYLGATQQWFMMEGSYAAMQSTKPQTLAYGLNDSPVGLAAWIIEKFRSWSDSDGNIEKHYTKDELLTDIMIYWVTETINSSFHGYYEQTPAEMQLQPGQRIDVPTGVAFFPKEFVHPPRELGERFLNVHRWTQMPRGGHFAALEEPELLVEEMREFFRPLRA